MRILIVGVKWPPVTFLARLIKGLTDAGMEVTVACSERPGKDWLSHPNFSWLRTPFWDISVTQKIFCLTSMLWNGLVNDPVAIWKIIKLKTGSFSDRLHLWFRLAPFVGRNWDAIYFPWNAAAIEYLPLFSKGWPVVISCRGAQINVVPHDPRRKVIRQQLKLTFQKATAVHCVSESIKNEACQYGLDPGKAWVIHPAVDPDFFRPGDGKKLAEGTFRIITTGSLIWRKGYEYALMAVRNLWDQGIPAHFHIIGGGQDYARLLYTIGDLNLEGKVYLHGFLAPSEVRNRLQEADAFLLSSLSEGIANAVLEAMACELPVVTTDCGGMREAVTHGKEGLVVPVRDPEAMAAALARLASDQELSRKLGQAARQRILKDFTLERQIGKFVQLYQEIINNSGRF